MCYQLPLLFWLICISGYICLCLSLCFVLYIAVAWWQQKGKPHVAKRKINFLDNNLAAVELVSPLLTSAGLSMFS